MLSQAQIDVVKSTVPVLQQHGDTVTQVFYQNLLQDNPSLKSIFNQANQVNGHQAKSLATAIYAYARNIENLGALGPALEHITQKHASLFIRPEQYEVVGRYLLAAFTEVLGRAFTPEIRDAWEAAYNQLAETMITAETELYKGKEGWTDWRDFVIAEKIQASSEITSFILKPVRPFRLPKYLPGQYISVQVEVPSLHYSQPRQYSLSDRYFPDHYRISVKRERGITSNDPKHVAHPGYVSNVLHDLKNAGDIIQVSPPSGEFFLDPSQALACPVVLISAGVGLTPLMAMLNSLVHVNPKRPVSWIQGARSSQTRAFAEHIRDLRCSYDSVHTTIFTKDVADSDQRPRDYDLVGRVDLSKCDRKQDLFLDDSSTEYYICGPDSFMTDMQKKLHTYGVEPRRIKSERFGTGELASPS